MASEAVRPCEDAKNRPIIQTDGSMLAEPGENWDGESILEAGDFNFGRSSQFYRGRVLVDKRLHANFLAGPGVVYFLAFAGWR